MPLCMKAKASRYSRCLFLHSFRSKWIHDEWKQSRSSFEVIQKVFKAVVLQDAGLHKCLTLRVFGNVTFMCLMVGFLHVRRHSNIPWKYEVYEHSTQPFLIRDSIRNYKYKFIIIIIIQLWIPGQCFSFNRLIHSSLFFFTKFCPSVLCEGKCV